MNGRRIEFGAVEIRQLTDRKLDRSSTSWRITQAPGQGV